ncbi:zinc-binding dehydrogenase [Lentzea sp. NPDC034063]|uniref:quinone oxidoreductase family protein n=1 Tax=unclassified Lentzea TaxID=2643253 RepID=UPI0033E45E8E
MPDPRVGPDDELITVTAVGVNFADTHQSDGSYLTTADPPFVPGSEVVGVTGSGRRVLALLTDAGGYAELVAAPRSALVEVPEEVTDAQALALGVQGLTAWHVLHSIVRLRRGESVVVNAAAGGVGSLAVQLAGYLGAGWVIGTASTRAKRDLALDLGADAVVDSRPDQYATRIVEANGGKRVDAVLDATGRAVFKAAMSTLAPFGRLVTFGYASRQIPASISAGELIRGVISVSGFWLTPLVGSPDGHHEPLSNLLALTAKGELTPVVGAQYPLADARRAHEDLLARRTIGKLILVP